eukprot:m.304628 g.304628  ORF g.304628 m.304628 type:complete len:63 (+) comp19606_c0_seq1:370-558(+)
MQSKLHPNFSRLSDNHVRATFAAVDRHFLNGSLSAVLKQEKRKVAFRASSRCRHKIHARVMW